MAAARRRCGVGDDAGPTACQRTVRHGRGEPATCVDGVAGSGGIRVVAVAGPLVGTDVLTWIGRCGGAGARQDVLTYPR